MRHSHELRFYQELATQFHFTCVTNTICFKSGSGSTGGSPFRLFSDVTRVPWHFPKSFSILSLNAKYKTLISSLIFIFTKFCSWNTMQRTSTKLSSALKNKIRIKTTAKFGISILFQKFVYIFVQFSIFCSSKLQQEIFTIEVKVLLEDNGADIKCYRSIRSTVPPMSGSAGRRIESPPEQGH